MHRAFHRTSAILILLGAVGCGGGGDDDSPTDGGGGDAAPMVDDAGRVIDGDVPDAAIPDGAAADACAFSGDPTTCTGTVTKVPGPTYMFTEGPVWRGDHLLFSDIDGNTIYRLTPPQTITMFRMPSNRSNGLAIDAAGNLLACEHATHRVSRTLANGTVELIATTFGGRLYNSPNDIIARADGNLYFTDPDYAADPNNRQPVQGIYRIDPTGAVTLIDGSLGKPNGIALSPDENTLYVADNQTAVVRRFTLNAQGVPGPIQSFVSTAPGPDGMAVDDVGNLYVTTTMGIEVFSPGGTRYPRRIAVPETPANCTFGGADRKTLYITARTGLYRVQMPVAGKP